MIKQIFNFFGRRSEIAKLKQTERNQLEIICRLMEELDEAKETIKAYQEISLNPSEEDKKRADIDCEKLLSRIIEER